MKLSHIHETIESHFPQHCNFEFGECGVQTYYIVKKALAAGLYEFIVVEGMVLVGGKIMPHTWIEINGEIKDPTASMFGHDNIEYSPEGEYREEYGSEEFVELFIDQYGDPDN